MQISTKERRIIAVLGPTNTGKTHFAMERMLAHESGIVGFPLRLLARENYERAIAVKGRGKVALITGEEKIVPPGAQYFICTAESMPLTKPVAFVALDEVQMCGDPDRGHVFTERLLRARGRYETMFMGAETMRRLIQTLVPETEFLTRPRMSSLSYAGTKKIARLPRRSALVAFTAPEIYALAELIRRQRGGAALVMGGLSPRTRNAQVAMYQDGEVDYLVATDAIGMGLNMDIDHVAFGATRKFDGRLHRTLAPTELGQIAGRAGRHMNDGSFGTTTDVGGFDEETVHQIENHEFEPQRQIYWRNWRLDHSSIETLRRSLAAPPDQPGLVRAREADDELVLGHLAKEPEVKARATDPEGVRLLWEVCQVPDFRKVMGDAHARFLASLFGHLRRGDERIPEDWIADQVQRLDRVDGDIDMLTQRISGIRMWTYVAYRAAWLSDAHHWQERTRAIEDKLSDVLHERLTQRFVDRRTSHLVKSLKERRSLLAAVRPDGSVLVEGHVIGRLEGFRFIAEAVDPGAGSDIARRAIDRAANLALAQEMETRVGRLAAAEDSAFSLYMADDGRLMVHWSGAGIGQLQVGRDVLHPEVRVFGGDQLSPAQSEYVQKVLRAWLGRHLKDALKPLFTDPADLPAGPARGLLYRLSERLGSLPRSAAAPDVAGLTRHARQALKKSGFRIGRESVYAPALLKPDVVELRRLLYGLAHDVTAPPVDAGRMSLPMDGRVPPEFYEAVGYRPMGRLAVRIDIVERAASRAWSLARQGAFPMPVEIMNLIGCGAEDTAEILKRLGYRRRGTGEGAVFVKQHPKAGRTEPGNPSRRKKVDPNSPFAKLGEMVVRS